MWTGRVRLRHTRRAMLLSRAAPRAGRLAAAPQRLFAIDPRRDSASPGDVHLEDGYPASFGSRILATLTPIAR